MLANAEVTRLARQAGSEHPRAHINSGAHLDLQQGTVPILDLPLFRA